MADHDADAPRALSLVNAGRPPQGRKRVWRACNWCKLKKAKCDGTDPCKACLNNSIECIYPEAGVSSGTKSFSIEHIQNLENRLLSMEAMFREFITKQPAKEQSTLSEQLAADRIEHVTGSSDHASGVTLVEGVELGAETIIDDSSMRPMSDIDSLTGADKPPGRSAGDWDRTTGDFPLATPRKAHRHNIPSLTPALKRKRKEIHVYTDEYGVLDTDSTGELRYVGSQATISIVNVCDGLRSYIRNGLEKKGYETKEAYWGSPSEHVDAAHRFQGRRDAWNLPPSLLVDALKDCYFERLYTIFPIIERDDFESQYSQVTNTSSTNNDFIPVLFALLAVAAPMLPLNDAVFDEVDCGNYRHENLGLYFYAMAKNALDYTHYTVVSLENLTFPLNTQPNSINKVIALGLSSAYLATTGHEAEAWTTIGSVVRLAQDLGLHRSPEKLRLPQNDWKKRRCVWLCLYVLDRSLSISLGRQLAINDVDCDIIQPDCIRSQCNEQLASFYALVKLHQISGEIISMTSSIGHAKSWHQSGDRLRQKVGELGKALQMWALDSVPPQVKHATAGRLFTERCVLLCAFFASIMLLHRPFMSNPHRESPLGDTETVKQCARAAINCIGSTVDCLASIPPCHFLSLYGQQVFVSCVLLLHCLRVSKDQLSMSEVVGHVQNGMDALKDLGSYWPGAKKCRGVVEEFLGFTQEVVRNGKRGRCYFHDKEFHQHEHQTSCHSISEACAIPGPHAELTMSSRRVQNPKRGEASMRHFSQPEHLHVPSSSVTTQERLSDRSHPTPSTSSVHSSAAFLPDFRFDFNMPSPFTPRRRRDDQLHHLTRSGPIGIDEYEGWFGAGDLLNKNNFLSEDYLSPFLLTSELMAPDDIWNVI